MSKKIKLAENLNLLMAERNWTMTMTAKKIGMNKSTLHDYCNGVVPRNVMKLKELSELFGLSMSELVFGTEPGASQDAGADALEGRYEIVVRRIKN